MHQIRLQRSPRPLAGFKGPTSKGRGEDWRGGEWRGGKGRGGERRGWQGKGPEGRGEGGKGREREKGSEWIRERGGRGREWGLPTYYLRLKSCTVEIPQNWGRWSSSRLGLDRD